MKSVKATREIKKMSSEEFWEYMKSRVEVKPTKKKRKKRKVSKNDDS